MSATAQLVFLGLLITIGAGIAAIAAAIMGLVVLRKEERRREEET